MDGYASEKEQIDRIRKWWKDNWKALTLGLVLGLGSLFGYRYWTELKMSRAESVSINYEHFLLVSAAGLSDEAVEAGRAIIESDTSRTYARLTALLLAKLAVEANQLDEAKSNLRWVIDKSSEGPLQAIARARLAQVLLAQSDADGAQTLLDKIEYASGTDHFAELRGDVLAASGNAERARTMYLKALEQAQELGLNREILQLKLDNLAATGS